MNKIFPEEDFLVFDQKETLNWTRPHSGLFCPVGNALRFSSLENVQNGSSVGVEETVWVFPKKTLSFKEPIPGDWLIDPQNVRWTISKVQDLSARNCWKCTAVNLLRHFQLTETLDLYRPRWQLDASGAPFPEYFLFRPGIPAKILPPTHEDACEIHIAEPETPIFYRDCFMTPTNQMFRVVEIKPAAVWSEVSKIFCKEVTQ